MSLRLSSARPLAGILLASVAVPALASAESTAPEAQTGSATTTQATSIIVTANRDGDRLPDQSGTLIFAGKLCDIAVLDQIPPVPSRNLRVALSDIPGLLVSEVSNGS